MENQGQDHDEWSPGMIFPILEINEGEITSIKGDVSRLFKIETPDFSQMGDAEKASLLFSFQSELRNLSEDEFYRIYYLNDKLYLNTSDKSVEYFGGNLHLVSKPLSMLLGDLNVFQDIEIFDDYLIVGQKYLRLLSLKEMPRTIDSQFLESFGDFVIHLKKIDPVEAKKKLDRKRKLHFSLTLSALRNIESEKAFQESEDLLEFVMIGEESVFNIEGWFVVTADSKFSLDEKTQELKKRANLQDFDLFTEIRSLGLFFSSIIPGVRPLFKRTQLVTSSFLSGLMPFPTEYLMSSGISLLSPKERNVYFNLFDDSAINFNLLITGTSGQGKSMMANKIIKDEVGRGRKIVILDLGNSFKKTVAYLNGCNFSMAFNPLQFKDAFYLKNFILSVVDDGFFSKSDQGRLFEVIGEICQSDFGALDSFDLFLEKLEENFLGIRYYFSEIKNYFTNSEVGFKKLTYCDLSLYPENIKAPLIVYLIEYFKNIEGQKIFVFDECWQLLAKNADYVAESFRTFRKHQASAVAISQNLEDFLSSPLGRVIYQNTHFQFLFKQEVLGDYLNESVKMFLEEVSSKKGEYSEFLVLSDSIKKIVRFYPTQMELCLFNTEKTESLKFERFEKERQGLLEFKEIFNQYLYLITGVSA
jgi:type IV secretory pathway VirB4 component